MYLAAAGIQLSTQLQKEKEKHLISAVMWGERGRNKKNKKNKDPERERDIDISTIKTVSPFVAFS